MAKITKVFAREILDSRGNPTIEVEAWAGGLMGRAAAPSGASRGRHEALEIRDGGKRYRGKGVRKAAANVNGKIANEIVGMEAEGQEEIDAELIELDGTENKGKLGGNAITATSMACAKLGAECRGVPLYEHLGGGRILPIPLMNIINGGKHAGNELAVQEFMIVPKGAKSFSEAVRMGSEIYHALWEILEGKYGRSARNVGDEGGYAPPMKKTKEAVGAIEKAIEKCDYGKKVKLALDCAAGSFFAGGKYAIDGKSMSASGLLEYYEGLLKDCPIASIEDPFEEEDWESFAEMTQRLGRRIQIVGDDLLVSNPEKVKEAARQKLANALLLKVNQVGTVSEARSAAGIAKKAGWRVVVSHRSGETEDAFIADFAVGINAGQIKTGAPARGERTCKYNQLLRIEEELGKWAGFGV